MLPVRPWLVLVIAASASAFASASSACGGSGGDCEQAFETARKCHQGKDLDKDQFLEGCRQLKKDPELGDEIEAELACAKEPSCEKVESCRQAQLGKARARGVAEAASAGRWKDAFEECTRREEYFADEDYKAECNKVFASLDKLPDPDLYRCKVGEKIRAIAPELEKACQAMAGGRHAAAVKAVLAARDGGDDSSKACLELKDLAGIVGKEASAAADRLCEESGAGRDAKLAMDAAHADAAARRLTVPETCDAAAERLSKLETEWSKQKLEDLYRACYLEIGAIVLEIQKQNTVCLNAVRKLASAIEKQDLAAKIPEIAALQKKLPARCR
jgi:hypothetical protein